MITFPNAKINIGLNITSKRPDGYHEIESVFFPVPLNDVLEVIEDSFYSGGDKIKMKYSGIAIPGNESNNLCRKAYDLISKDYSLPPVTMHLHKTIPIGAGLGGGSADGAFCIRLLNEKFQLHLGLGEMYSYAKELGSDCPFFIKNLPSYVTGRGEHLEPLPLNVSGHYIYLINPGIHISTKEAYSMIIPKEGQNLRTQIKKPIKTWKDTVVNDFEEALVKKYPDIAKVKSALYDSGAIYAAMTGSGSTVYGIFDREPSRLKNFESYFHFVGKI